MFIYHTKEIDIGQPNTIDSGAYLVVKQRGETLASLLDNFRHERNLGSDIKVTYAGRLDPMAEGLVIILVGNSRFEKDKLLNLSKVYEIEVLIGVSTDTADALGIVTKSDFRKFDTENILSIVKEMEDIRELPYPKYSSIPVLGKPLFVHARQGNDVEIPIKKIKIFKTELIDIKTAKINELSQNIIRDIKNVSGDFRQEEISRCWQKFADQNQDVFLIKIRAEVSSGTYMRSLAVWLGEKMGMPALAYSIRRTRVGNFE